MVARVLSHASEKSMHWYQRWIARPLSIVATIVMFFMMMLTLVDVVGRYLFSTPVTGAFEITEIMLASVIFLGLPLVTSERDHIAVDIIDSLVSSRTVGWLKRIASLVGAVSFSLLAWMLWEHAFKNLRYGDTTAVLEIPYAWLTFLMATAVSLSALALYIILIIDLTKKQ
ncbi:MAG: TRAP transporter small permease [Oceanospirillales bacterium]|nr:TRAP transporter small permease [Oceanospirillales bacterium]